MPLYEHHKSQRVGWLRAAVLGANDGIVSTASLIIGVTAANSAHSDILLAGIAGLVAGAVSMAAGEYVSVSSQSDTEKADLELEKISLENNIEYEKKELEDIYVKRGLDRTLAIEVARQLMAKDALAAHARDELGFSESYIARPIQAALSSAAAFTAGSVLPVACVWFVPLDFLIPAVAMVSLTLLAVLGGLAAYAGGAPLIGATMRVCFWGALAMSLTAGVGRLFNIVL